MRVVETEVPNRCPRCGGVLNNETDKFGSVLVCLYCGENIEVITLAEVEAERRRAPSHAAVGAM